MYDTTDTIAAIATPLGESGIGVIRISGSHAYAVGDAIFRSPSGTPLAQRRDRSIQHGLVVADDGRPVDEVLMLIMKGPHSYTAEDVLEIQCHGGRKALEEILSLVLAHGARLANPGEFTQRAFVNGRIDPAQAEAVMDVIQAKSRQGLTSAVNQLEGRLSKVIGAMRHELTDFITRLEVTIDYPEEDLEDITVPDVAGAIRKQLASLDEMLEASHDGRIIRDGVMAAIAGTPNAGKSSLLNRLLGRDRAIVTDIPGTTRDTLEEQLDVRGVPVRVIDTAGIRETADVIERSGMERARLSAQDADIIVWLFDLTRPYAEQAWPGWEVTGQVLLVGNKLDACAPSSPAPPPETLRLSVRTGEGLDGLLDAVERLSGVADTTGEIAVAARHAALLAEASEALSPVGGLLAGGQWELAALELRRAVQALGRMVGREVEPDVLETIFHRFCIGK